MTENKEAQEHILKLEQDNNVLKEEIQLLRKELQKSKNDLLDNNNKNFDPGIDPLTQSLPNIKDLVDDSVLNKSFIDSSRNFYKAKATSYVDKLNTISNPLTGQMDEVTSEIERWTKRLKHLAQEVLIFSNARYLRRISEVISNGGLKNRTINTISFTKTNVITDGSKTERNRTPKLKVSDTKKSLASITKTKHNNFGAGNPHTINISIYF